MKIAFEPEYTGSPLVLPEGGKIVCSSDGQPTPTYTWFCNGQQWKVGAELYIDSGLARGVDVNTCYCTAENQVDGENFGIARYIEFYGVCSCN